MVTRLDDPQPTFPLPPIDEIPDEAEDKPIADAFVNMVLGPLVLPAIIFGAATFSKFYSTDDHIGGVVPARTVRLALRYGICAFDTSPYYGPSEIILGNALKALEHEFPRSSYKLITKCGRYGDDPASFDYSPKGVRASVHRSLARLHTSYLDNVYLHDIEFIADVVAPGASGNHVGALGTDKVTYGLAEGQESKIWGDGDRRILGAISELRKLQEEGIVKNIGISCYSLPILLRIALLVLHTDPYKPLDTILSYSQLNLQNASLEAWVPAFYRRAKVKQVLTASPFCMGLLTYSPPTWHHATLKIKGVTAEVVGASEWKDGFPDLALGYSFRRGRRHAMPNVVGLSTLKEVHETARVWKVIQDDEESRMRCEEMVRKAFEEQELLDVAWTTESF